MGNKPSTTSKEHILEAGREREVQGTWAANTMMSIIHQAEPGAARKKINENDHIIH